MEGVLDFGYFVKRDIEKKDGNRIEGSRYNGYYREIKGSGIPEYLKREWGGGKQMAKGTGWGTE